MRKSTGRTHTLARTAALGLSLLTAAGLLSGCNFAKRWENRGTPEHVVTDDDAYVNSAEPGKPLTYGVDALGRKLVTASQAPEERKDRYVGMFYFLWLGEHGTDGPYDNSVISQVPGALDSVENWMAAGGGPTYLFHFWGKPLFDYYVSKDTWVLRKHVQLLTDAGVDFLVFDTTNAYTYSGNALKLMKILHEYKAQGWDVPGVAFYTNTDSGDTMMRIYREVYLAHPEYSDVWFLWDGKPLIIGNPWEAEMTGEALDFFTVKQNQWPFEPKKENGFPWMEFGRLLTPDAVYGTDGRKEVISVSVAQHCETCTFSLTAWYGANDRTRSWHRGANDKSKNAYLYGYNFAEQFEFALKQDPEIIFVTGWNEWIAQRQPSRDGGAVIFVDNADADNSRDLEPMEGGYGDNYYMQLISYVRRFKGTDGGVKPTYQTVDIDGGFAQWNDVASYYRDYENDIGDRKQTSYGGEILTDESGRNDIVDMKVCEDKKYVYFLVTAKEPITAPEGSNWMNLFLSDRKGKGWNGYRYVLNYREPDREGFLHLGKLADSEEYRVTEVCEVPYRIFENMLMCAVPKKEIGMRGNASFWFKWADHCTEGDLFGFYRSGDAAPIGRAGYYYGYGL